MDSKDDDTAEGTVPATTGPGHWALMRDAAVFQVKLVIDGFRDLVLIPASFVAAIMSLASARDGRPGPQFYRLLGIGKRSERWIDLFAAYRHAPPGTVGRMDGIDTTVDDVVRRVESFIVDEYRQGGVTRQAKDRIDAALHALRRRQQRGDSSE